MRDSLNLLVADDSQVDRFLLQRAFDETGVALRALFVVDGQEVLDYLKGVDGFGDRQEHPLPALIILDLKMPRLNAFDVLKWLKSQPDHHNTPVMILTDSDDAQDINRAYRMGVSAYVRKPSRASEIPDLVRAIENFWHRFVKLPTGN